MPIIFLEVSGEGSPALLGALVWAAIVCWVYALILWYHLRRSRIYDGEEPANVTKARARARKMFFVLRCALVRRQIERP